MNSVRHIASLSVLSLALFAGCDRSDNTAPSKPSNPPPSGLPATPSASAAGETSPAAPAPPPAAAPVATPAAEAVQAQAAETKAAAQAQAVETKAAVQAQAAETKTAVETQAATLKSDAVAASSALAADAEKKLTEVMDYIKTNKLDLADTALQKIEAHKATFSAALQEKITKARSALDAAKNGTLNLPALPSIGGK